MLSTLDPSCDLIEAGREPVYEKKAISRMLDSRVIPGNIVNRWDMTSLYGTPENQAISSVLTFQFTFVDQPSLPVCVLIACILAN